MHRFRTRLAVILIPATLAWSSGAPQRACAESSARDAGGDPLRLIGRAREKDAGTGRYAPVEKILEWDASGTAVVICDMWSEHWCKGATRRVAELAPFMNRVVRDLRQKGALVVHAPSGTMQHYEGTPQRERAKEAPEVEDPPETIRRWCGLQPSIEGALPIDDSDGGCDCEPECKVGQPWRRQIADIEIAPPDAISDSGLEIWNLFASRHITNVMLLGVHTNMCVLGRPFGIRNMVRAGKNVVLVRDLTDTMYNSRRSPRVSHFRGTDLVVEHIEKHWCPTVASSSITGEADFRFSKDNRARVTIVAAENLYNTPETLTRFAAEALEQEHGFQVRVLKAAAGNRNVIVGLEALEGTDLLVLSARRRALPDTDLERLRRYLAAGKPLVALRTSSHAFDARGSAPPGHGEWRAFDSEVLGGNYHGHHRDGITATVRPAPGAGEHPILRGVEPLPFASAGSLYKSSPLQAPTTTLLVASIPGQPEEPVAWTHAYHGARVFYTSLGHPDDFGIPQFRRLLENAILWGLGGRAAGR